MRDKLVLWQIVEAEFDRIYDRLGEHKGLCNVIAVLMTDDKLIEWKEYVFLIKIIWNYQTLRNQTIFENRYIWNPEHKKPRKMFIQKQIRKARQEAWMMERTQDLIKATKKIL